MNLYHVSLNPNLATMIPRVPNSAATGENKTIKRVCFAPTIKSALAADPLQTYGRILYVYKAVSVNERYVYKPTTKEVPDAGFTHEVWYLAPVNVKKIAVIVVGDPYKRKVWVDPNDIFEDYSTYWWKYKKFKEYPSKEEINTYYKTQPITNKQMLQNKENKIKAALKKVFKVPVFSMVGGLIKRIV